MPIELEALKKRLFVDNAVRNIKFFPGSRSDVSPEDFAREINNFFGEVEDSNNTLNIGTDIDGV